MLRVQPARFLTSNRPSAAQLYDPSEFQLFGSFHKRLFSSRVIEGRGCLTLRLSRRPESQAHTCQAVERQPSSSKQPDNCAKDHAASSPYWKSDWHRRKRDAAADIIVASISKVFRPNRRT